MILLISILAILFGLAAWMGFRQLFRLELLNQQIVINSFMTVMGVLTVMTIANWMGILTQQIAANLTMGIYTVAAGFFSGYGLKLISFRNTSGYTEYVYRSFWTDIAPNLIAVILVAFGIYRTGLLTLGPFTGIGITSGISLIAFGFWGWTIRVVPEFRNNGLLFLDQYIDWEKLVSYTWTEEETIEIDYLTDGQKLTSFSTYIPEEDRLIIERILGKKLKENEEQRTDELMETNQK